MDKLRVCPFCGSDRISMDHTDYVGNPGYTQWCKNCGAIGPNELTAARATGLWNLRRTEDDNIHILTTRLDSAAKSIVQLEGMYNGAIKREAAVTAELANLKQDFEAYVFNVTQKAKTLAADFAQLRAENAWIPCSERLPEVDHDYPWHTIDVQAWDGQDILSPAFYYVKDVPTFGWKAGQWRCANKVIVGVTHYRPLPPPPDGDRSEK